MTQPQLPRRAVLDRQGASASKTIRELSRVMGTSVRMIELHYRTLIAGAAASIAARLDALA
jgi:hypothetical protein